MKITIDTVYKTVEVNNENLKEVVDFMSTHFPETWKEYQISVSNTWTVYPTYTPPNDFNTYVTCTSNQQN